MRSSASTVFVMADLTKLEWTREHDFELGKRITEARADKGVSLQVLAERLGVAKATVGHWESGQRTIKHHDLACLSVALDVSPDHLLLGRSIWPFEGIDPRKIARLEADDLMQLQGALLLAAGQIGLDIGKAKAHESETSRKRTGTNG